MSGIFSLLPDCDFLLGLEISTDGRVLGATNALLRHLGLQEAPLGSPLESLLHEESPGVPAKGEGNGPWTGAFPLALRSASGKPVWADFALKHLKDSTILLAAALPEADADILAKMSALNLEMANLTRELTKKYRELEEANATITRLMNTDPLTGVANRRHFQEIAKKAMAFSARNNSPLSLTMADLDHFKTFNDRYGHAVGDQVLVKFAEMLLRTTRLEDTVARHGGEEFLVLFPGINLEKARRAAERLRQQTELLAVPGISETIRASFGVSQYEPGESLETFIERADRALYRAKAAGRNRVE